MMVLLWINISIQEWPNDQEITQTTLYSKIYYGSSIHANIDGKQKTYLAKNKHLWNSSMKKYQKCSKLTILVKSTSLRTYELTIALNTLMFSFSICAKTSLTELSNSTIAAQEENLWIFVLKI